MILAESQHFIQFPGLSAKWVIGIIALFHTAVASLAIGFAFCVTVMQILAYRKRDGALDTLARRTQLWHVCVYNIGTINAIGLVFVLSGLYPQFWGQIFTNYFWPMIMEEFAFFLLATTVTFHYFFWDYLRGHRKLHIFIGSLLTPLFLIQFYLINGMGGFMLTPGVEVGSVSQWAGTAGITGYDKEIFYNPSFLMLTFHRALANISYGAFIVAAICGYRLFTQRAQKNDLLKGYYEQGGRTAFHIGFFALLGLPIVGFFYAWVLKYHAVAAYNNLMFGRGDVVAGGIDWWWLKHVIVISMIGMALMLYWRASRGQRDRSIPGALLAAIAAFYIVFYAGMGMQMTWFFFVAMLAAGVGAALIAGVMITRSAGSARGVLLAMGVLSFLTVMLGGYVREASRPRFVGPSGGHIPGAGDNRFAHYDEVYRDPEREVGRKINMVLDRPEGIAVRPSRPNLDTVEALAARRCISCHTMQRMRNYEERRSRSRRDWGVVIRRMKAYGTDLGERETRLLADYFAAGQVEPTTEPSSHD